MCLLKCRCRKQHYVKDVEKLLKVSTGEIGFTSSAIVLNYVAIRKKHVRIKPPVLPLWLYGIHHRLITTFVSSAGTVGPTPTVSQPGSTSKLISVTTDFPKAESLICGRWWWSGGGGKTQPDSNFAGLTVHVCVSRLIWHEMLQPTVIPSLRRRQPETTYVSEPSSAITKSNVFRKKSKENQRPQSDYPRKNKAFFYKSLCDVLCPVVCPLLFSAFFFFFFFFFIFF